MSATLPSTSIPRSSAPVAWPEAPLECLPIVFSRPVRPPFPSGAATRGSEQSVHHRSPEFREILRRVTSNPQYLFQTSQPVLTLTSSGAVEATVLNLFAPGDTVIWATNRRFAERWAALLGMYGMNLNTTQPL